MRTFLLLTFFATNTMATPPSGSCHAAIAAAPSGPDGWLLLAAIVLCAAGRWSR